MGNGRQTRPLHDHAHAAVRSCLRLYLTACPRCRPARVCMPYKSICRQLVPRKIVHWQKVLRPSCLRHSRNGTHLTLRLCHSPVTSSSTLLILARRLPVRFGVTVPSPCHHQPRFHFPLYPPSQHSSPLHP